MAWPNVMRNFSYSKLIHYLVFFVLKTSFIFPIKLTILLVMAKLTSNSSRVKKVTPISASTVGTRVKPSSVPEVASPGKSFANRIQYVLLLLSLLAPAIFSTRAFFGFTSVRVLYFELIVMTMIVVSIWQNPVWQSRISNVQSAILIFLGIMTLANALGVDPVTSFWSGFARMEGFVTYIYLVLYCLIIARSRFSNRQWTLAFILSVSVAILLIVASYLSKVGWMTNDRRLIGTVGNPTFFAIYLLQQLIIAALLLIRIRSNSTGSEKWLLVTGSIVAATILLAGIVFTGSRSAFVSLGIGSLTLGLLVGIRYIRKNPKRVFMSIGAVLLVISLGWVILHTEALQHQPVVYRLTHLSGSLNTWRPRQISIHIALNAIEERPILGWGQDNYNYGFAQHYIPELALEGTDWYDRVHNVPLDWAFSGGIIGLIAYLFIWFAGIFQLHRSTLPYLQKQILTAGLVAFFVFNLFNPDSTLALQGFFLIVAFIDTYSTDKGVDIITSSSSAILPTWLKAGRLFIIPSLLLLTYFAAIVPIGTLRNLNQLILQPTFIGQISLLEKTYQSATIGKIDVADQLVSLTLSVLNDPSISATDKQIYYKRAAAVWSDVCQRHPQSSRYKIRLASLHLAHDNYEKAFQAYENALTIEKGKRPNLFIQIGSAYLQQGNVPAALTAFRQAHQLVPTWEVPIVYEAIGYIVDHNPNHADLLLHQLSDSGLVTNITLVKQAYYMAKNPLGLMKRIEKVGFKHQFSPEVYVQWSTAAFDAHNSSGLLTSLNSFARHYGARFDYSLIKQLYDDAINHQISPTEGIRQLVNHL